jgi:hypothetical protein
MRETSASGAASLQALERLLGPADLAVGRLLGLDLAALLGVVAGLGQRRVRSMTCSGACTTT